MLSTPTHGTPSDGAPTDDTEAAPARSDPLLDRLDAIASRLDRLERHLAPVGDLVEQAPAAIATATDTFDAAIARHPDWPERAARAAALAERVTDADTAAALHKGLDVVEGVEGMVAMTADTLDDAIARRPDLPERLERVLALTERLTRDDTLASLHKALDVLDGMEGVVATAIDALDERLTRVADMHERLEAAERLVINFTEPAHLNALCWLATASMHGATAEVEPMSAWSAFKASREPEVQRALGIAVNIARSLGADHKQLCAPGEGHRP